MEKIQVKLYLTEKTAEALRVAAAKRGGQGAMSAIAEKILRRGLGMKRWFKQIEGSEILVKCLDANNNYSLAGGLDPEWEGYTDHVWGKDTAEWIEIGEAEAETILGGEVVVINGREVDYDAAVNLMDNEIREELHSEIAPCTNQEFINAYIERHRQKFSEEFVVS